MADLWACEQEPVPLWLLCNLSHHELGPLLGLTSRQLQSIRKRWYGCGERAKWRRAEDGLVDEERYD